MKTSAIKSDPSLRASIRDGVYNAVMIGAGESYLGAFAIFLKGSSLQIGTLATLPPFLGAIFQNAGVWCIERFGNRKALLAKAAFLHALIWLPIALLPYLFDTDGHIVTLLIGLVMIYHCLAGFTAPIWNSLIGDLVPPQIRGRFFGMRNRMCGIFTFAALIIAGKILDVSQHATWAREGFLIVFLVALVARFQSARRLNRYQDPPYRPSEKHHFSFFDFIRRAPYSNFAKFVFFVSTMNFSVAISGPYYAVYMLRDLHWSYFQFTMISAAATIAQFLTMQRWGRLSDRYGNKKILNVCAVAVAVCPLFWLPSTNIYVIFLVQLYSGFVWAGFNLAASNFMFDAVTPPKRARCVAYQALINCSFVFAGSYIGGYIATHWQSPFDFHSLSGGPASPYLLLFFLSGVARILTAMFFVRLFREVREVEKIKHRDLIFHITHLRPISGATFGVVTGFIRGKSERKAR